MTNTLLGVEAIHMSGQTGSLVLGILCMSAESNFVMSRVQSNLEALMGDTGAYDGFNLV